LGFHHPVPAGGLGRGHSPKTPKYSLKSRLGLVPVAISCPGIGLDSSSTEKVFAAFHTTKLGGLGMGLSISRSIVGNHQGRLWATAHEGPGASFHFPLLPA
jgi:C4-dicarboxylate-specific signal transduction histidine kinase